MGGYDDKDDDGRGHDGRDHDGRADGARWDVVVVGGGSAGLSAALTLVRARRRVLVLDAGAPRNRAAPHLHGLLGHDGTEPLALLAAGRDEVRSYGGEVRRAEVVDAHRDAAGLVVTTADGEDHRARRLVVATGLHDDLPDVPGLAEQWGRGVVVCPYCDGYELRERRIGVLATTPGSPHQAQLVRQWSASVVYLPHTVDLPDDERRALHARGIEVVEGVVERVLEHAAPDRHADEQAGADAAHGTVRGVRLADGRDVALDALFTGPIAVPLDEPLVRLGAERTQTSAGSFVAVDRTGRTSVDGVWAVGNVTGVPITVPVAIGAGALAGGTINHDLVDEDVRLAVAATGPARATATPEHHDAPGGWHGRR